MQGNKKNKNAAVPRSLGEAGSKFVKICFHILFFVTPLLLWPFTTEVFEFNKMIFVYFMTTIIISGWLIASFKNKKLEIAKTPLDLPLLLFFLSQLASTILSINPHTSLWGYYSRFHGGLASTICYILLFYAFVSNFQNDLKGIRLIIKTILATATLTAFYAILEHFGIDKNIWVQDVQNRVFSTLGQPNWLSAYLIAILPLPLYFALKNKNKTRYFYLLPFTFYLTAIIFTKSQSGLGATAVILFLFFIFWSRQQKSKLHLFIVIPLLLLTFYLKQDAALRTLHSLNKINPFYSSTQAILNEENKTRIGGSDSMSIRRVVWEGALTLGKKYPFFGSGLETFGYAYYNVRPVAHNFTSETDFLYNKAHNEYLNFLATSGFIGLATYLFLIFSIISSLRGGTTKQSPPNELSTPLLLGFISILITNYFGFSVVNIALFFFLFPAIYLSVSPQNQPSPAKGWSAYGGTIYHLRSVDSFVPVLITILMALFCLNKVKNLWLGDIYYGKGKSNLEASLKAVKLNPSEPLYVSQLGYVQSLIATQVIYPQLGPLATAEAGLKQKAEKYFDLYVADSLANAQKATSMNPFNLNLLKNRARTELSLATIDPKYNYLAVNTLLKIIELSPTDPANYYNLGVLYKSTSNKDEAIRAFNKALELYPLHEGAKAQLSSLR